MSIGPTGTTPRPAGPTGVAAWLRDLTTGARFALTGGRDSWLRTALTAVGVGLGVTLLLIAASVPEMLSQRSHRESARAVPLPAETPARLDPAPGTLLVRAVETDFRDKPVRGTLVRADGPEAPVPPGLDRLPGPGEMVLSPALERLLKSDEGALLRDRFAHRLVGTISDAGLAGPSELYYYVGSDRLATDPHASRVDHFGGDTDLPPPDAVALVLGALGCVVLLMPVAVFLATAVRFGGEQRDRRLAALRLVGADVRTVRRIAAGEALCGALAGMAVGACLFLFLRGFATGVTIREASVFPADLAPSAPLAALVALAVPAAAVLVTLFALRRVAVEPLGVTRDGASRRRRLWWRLLVPAVGVALLLPGLTDANVMTYGISAGTYRIALGAVLVLVGVTALLPWLVERCVARLRGGPVAWQLAVRRLQLNSGPAARAVSGITVAVAGAIAIQMFLAGTQSGPPRPEEPSHSALHGRFRPGTAAEVRGWVDRLKATEGVTGVTGFVERYADKDSGGPFSVTTVTVGDCATLRELAELGSCREGDTFVAQEPDGDVDTAGRFPPGTPLTIKEWADGPSPRTYRWTVPTTARVVPTRPDAIGEHRFGVLATPSAIDVPKIPDAETTFAVKVRPGDLDAIERVRNTAAAVDPSFRVWRAGGVVKDDHYAAVRQGLLAGAVLILFLIGASMLVGTLEQLRERRRLLSALVASGVPRATVGWSVLWQTAIPVILGLALAVAGGLGLGWATLALVGRTVRDWTAFVPLVGAGASVIVLVTLASLPPLWRLMRPDGLHTE
ncbi:integral membrane protein [Streptomyces albireticuli]|uniref:Integral membrane protein n=1 Tax=Streptomyces albireticuli TaxID=1940 RepID=A0A1Z2L1P5_9ACTN|nr:FtsX-like permease family protein [Streptomyces albireticuli]ARZ68141.1 integral membrane protein [Streptomyces albireticuli]